LKKSCIRIYSVTKLDSSRIGFVPAAWCLCLMHTSLNRTTHSKM